MRRSILFSCIILASLASGGCQIGTINRSGSTTTVQRVPAAARLHYAAISVRNLDPIYAAESQRLERMCPPPRPDGDMCRARNVSSQRHRVATLYSRPDASSPPAVFINARLYYRPEYDLLFALDLELADRPGEFVLWIPDLGDWGYGTHIDGRVRVEGEWVQFIDPVIRVPAWTPKEPESQTADLYTYVDSIAGHIFHMEPLEATNPDGTREMIASGDFLVTRVSEDVVEFRLEVESDYACGEDIPPPPVMPPTLRASPDDFFNADGTPRFATKYTKGC